jgi:glycine/D-amino acid oxidase-like deaminating enzyme
MAGRTLPLAPKLGFVTRVSGVEQGVIRRVMHAPRLHMRPDGDGLIALHHHEADAGITAGDKPWEWARELVERFKSYVPAAAEARVSRWTVATRPIPADGRTSAGLLPAIPGYGEIVTHSAITLGALLPRSIAHEIVTGEIDPLLANFRPERFS